MREIKFRAWDKTTKFMDDRVRTTCIEGDITVEVLDAFTDWRELKKDEFVLMQYTNLKDKNGKEIYEGDIISIFNSEMNIEFIGVVKFDDCCFTISIKKQYGGKFDVTGVRSTLLGVTDNEYIVTLLGNIYENADLLEVDE